MSKKIDSNPLFEGQREKSGSVTFDKYSFQYHWALYRVISNHSDQQEYAVIIELHEDVVVSNSLNVDRAKFEFNQVKTNKSPFNTHQLVEIKKGGNSVLGKLIKDVSSKPYVTKIETLNLVTSNKFNLELAKENVELKIIRKEDLSSIQISDLESELKKEIGISDLPENLRFIISDISDSDYQTILIGTIAKLIVYSLALIQMQKAFICF
ncbi:dsDNA nuclease domain-containing protein [Aquirufa aurantiipilula]|nr:dsDNA nuclease domain-containing protein [Aquirufa aurantiipilula]